MAHVGGSSLASQYLLFRELESQGGACDPQSRSPNLEKRSFSTKLRVQTIKARAWREELFHSSSTARGAKFLQAHLFRRGATKRSKR